MCLEAMLLHWVFTRSGLCIQIVLFPESWKWELFVSHPSSMFAACVSVAPDMVPGTIGLYYMSSQRRLS